MFGKKARLRRAAQMLAQMDAMMYNMLGDIINENSDKIAARIQELEAEFDGRDNVPQEVARPIAEAFAVHNASVDAYEAGDRKAAEAGMSRVSEILKDAALVGGAGGGQG